MKNNIDIEQFSMTRQLIRLQVKTEKNIKISVRRDNRTNEVTTKAIRIPKHVIKNASEEEARRHKVVN